MSNFLQADIFRRNHKRLVLAVCATALLAVQGNSRAVFGAVPAASADQPQAPANSFVIRNVRIFDGHKVIAKGSVWVEDGWIEAVGAKVKAPASLRVVDGAGGTLLPGLIDAHTHTFGPALQEALIFGVTTELDMFTDEKYAAKVRAEQAQGKDPDQADLFSAGTLVTVAGGHGTEYGLPIPTLASASEAQTFVDARIAEGSDYIKVIYDDASTYGRHRPTLSKEEMAAVVAAAHKRGKLAIVHIGSLEQAHDAINAGADGLAHLFVDKAPEADFGKFVAAHHAFVVGTLTVLESVTGTPSGASLVNDARLSPYLTVADMHQLRSTFPKFPTQPQLRLEYAFEAVRELKAAKVPILAGTDAGNPGTSHGASLHREMELLVKAGLTPVEALIAATSAPAAAFHLDDRGSIEPGKRADLLLVKSDPTRDILETRDIVEVWKAGVEADRASYRAEVEKERAATAAASSQPGPPGSESGLVSDFEDGTTSAKFGAGWQASSDTVMNGKSTSAIRVVSPGAHESKGALEISGELVPGFAYPFAGAMFSPGPKPFAPANLASKKVIRFWTRGDGRSYFVLVYAQSLGFVPGRQTFVAGPEWKEFEFPLTAFGTDGHDLTGIFFGATTDPGKFNLQIDDVRIE
jgi:imidazolonepropionase-like amidohydrolase